MYSLRTLGNSVLGWRRRSNKHGVKNEWRQVNEKFFELKRDIIIGIVEKVQETSSDSGCVLECRETPTSQVTI